MVYIWNGSCMGGILANGIDEEERKKGVLLSVYGAGTYEIVRSLLAPQLPVNKTYNELI